MATVLPTPDFVAMAWNKASGSAAPSPALWRSPTRMRHGLGIPSQIAIRILRLAPSAVSILLPAGWRGNPRSNEFARR
jgi:hypothetical protein